MKTGVFQPNPCSGLTPLMLPPRHFIPYQALPGLTSPYEPLRGHAGGADAELLGREFAGVGVVHPAEEGVAQFFDVFQRKIEQFRI